ncbi:PH domain-containing protein [Halobacillus shinanisalinarum]|uniref:PH domain-containing protein n=1 Tax=Halobacillus shinanisalinarum TaxID=2932258 RepID=A0ABY4GZ28_9BACI|nr:PH domain-containing protein [Halobacillus shinanisalinarum]UOQ92657.1 PH domain-containing protein [Halobacillus shinanisalinarum]
MMFEPQRLHPVSAVLNFVKGLKDAIFPIIAIFFLNGNQVEGFLNWLPLILSASFLVLILIAGIVKWLRFTYRVQEGELRIEYGLIFRKKRYIPMDRIQSLNFSEGVLHRPFQLVKVSIETAGSPGSQEAEAELTAIKRSEAKRLEEIIYHGKQERSFVEEQTEEQGMDSDRMLVYGMTMKDLVLMALTSGGAGVVISGVAVFFSQIIEFLPVGTIYEEVLDWLQIGVLIVGLTALLILLLAYGISVILTVLRFGKFSVFIEGEDLIITRGLLEKKQITIPLNRIQGIRVDENMIRQPLGFATISIISAGGSIKGDAEQQFKVLPLIKRSQIKGVMESILPQYDLDVSLKRPPKRARIRYLVRCVLFPAVLAIAASVFFWPVGLVSLLIVPIFIGLGVLNHRDAGWNVRDKQLTLSYRFMTKQTYVMKKHRIQSSQCSQSILQKRARLSSVEVTLKTGVGKARAHCHHLENEDIEQIMDWFKHENIG